MEHPHQFQPPQKSLLWPLPPVPQGPALLGWLEERLKEERQMLERRHQAVCEALVTELYGGARKDEACLETQKESLTPRDEAPAAGAPQTPEPLTPRDEVSSETSPPRLQKRQKSPRSSASLNIRGGGDKHSSLFHRVVLGHAFEGTFGMLIVLNSIIMALEVQHDGLALGQAYGSDDSVEVITKRGIAGWPGAYRAFGAIEIFFGAIFTLEVILKCVALGQRFINDLWNWFDSLIVCFWLVTAFNQVVSLPMNPMVLRACRLVRLLRLLRLAKMSSMFDVLVLMISSVQASAAVLLWGVTLLLLFMTIGSFILNSLLEEAMSPGSYLSEDTRSDIYRHFGTYSRSMLTMFEVTMASWVSPCRLLVDNVGEAYAIFFVVYKCVVGFAVLKVITGVFLHETFRCAGLDDDLMIQNRRRMRDKFKMKMMAFFDGADGSDGNGEVSCAEFAEMINNDRVNTWLEAMDLRIRDIGADRIFAFLAGPDMTLTRDELCSGMSRLRGAAQGLDVLTLLEISNPRIKMPPSRDVLRLTGGGDQTLPQPTAGASAPAAAEMQWAVAELCTIKADLRSALSGGAGAGRENKSPLSVSRPAFGAASELGTVRNFYCTV